MNKSIYVLIESDEQQFLEEQIEKLFQSLGYHLVISTDYPADPDKRREMLFMKDTR